jgi:hypothetical protein
MLKGRLELRENRGVEAGDDGIRMFGERNTFCILDHEPEFLWYTWNEYGRK